MVRMRLRRLRQPSSAMRVESSVESDSLQQHPVRSRIRDARRIDGGSAAAHLNIVGGSACDVAVRSLLVGGHAGTHGYCG